MSVWAGIGERTVTEEDRLRLVKQFYDNEYYRGVGQSESIPWHYRMIADRLGEMAGKDVLDVACGRGVWLSLLQERGARIHGIDISEKSIENCNNRLSDGKFICGPAETLPYESERFDIVTCLGSLEHFLDKPAALSEMVRVARANAQFLLLVPNAGFLTRRLGLYKGTSQTKIQEDVLTLYRWRELFTDAGIEITNRYKDLHVVNFDWIMRGPFVGWPFRVMQAIALMCWPVSWQYQVFHLGRKKKALPNLRT